MYFCAKLKRMKKSLMLVVFLFFSQIGLAQNEVGPEGGKLFVVLAAAILLALVMFLFINAKNIFNALQVALFSAEKIKIEIKKDRKYYPDILELIVKNTGRGDVDISQPVLVFDNFWFKRKFKLKGTNNYHFYPLILEKGNTHALKIDLNRFYRHDNRLKKYPKARIIITERKGKRLGTKSVFLRKTLVKF